MHGKPASRARTKAFTACWASLIQSERVLIFSLRAFVSARCAFCSALARLACTSDTAHAGEHAFCIGRDGMYCVLQCLQAFALRGRASAAVVMRPPPALPCETARPFPRRS